MSAWEIINYALALIAIVLLIAVCWISLDKHVTDDDLRRAGNIFLFAAMSASVFIFSVFVLSLKHGVGI